jgi:hypothetical protein
VFVTRHGTTSASRPSAAAEHAGAKTGENAPTAEQLAAADAAAAKERKP